MKTHHHLLFSLGASIALFLAPQLFAETDGVIIGVTEPQEQIDLSFPESGVIRALEIEEGDRVSEGQILAQLDCRVLESQLAIARMHAESPAAIQSANATLTMRKQRLDQLEKLAASQNANHDELARAKAEYEIAQADVQLAHEAAAESELQAQQTEAQIEQRTLRAPFDGIVARIHHKPGASVSPNDGPVLTLVKLDQLELVVYIDHRRMDGLETGQSVTISALDREVTGTGTIEFISPVVDPSSGTARLRIALPNEDGRHRSGVKYRVNLPGSEVAAAPDQPRR
ncbi:MAG: efflux RND transporter periplasmic adaptor subunit [Verrucomicrobiae bacterium]|nr:efflux RND transporter periplasmic adaptor subunit [Verrucomicrobiae bacterium]